MKQTLLETPENKLTAIITLASSVDGVDIVVGAHEGLLYSVESPNPDMQPYAEELASISAGYAETASTRALSGAPSVILASHRDKSLLVASLGEGYTVAILGEPPAIAGLLEPVRRIVEGSPLKCPKCGALLEVFTQTCPRCGRRVPFGATSCPFCGADLTQKTCPNCGTALRLAENRLEVSEAARPTVEAKPVAAERPEAVVSAEVGEEAAKGFSIGAKVGLATIGAVVYYLLAWALNIPLGEATLAGIVPIAIGYILAAIRGG